MTESTERMTLQRVIEKLENGWGFAHPGHVMVIGQQLRQIFKDSPDLRTEVEAYFCSDSDGWGASYRYIYQWIITGVDLPNSKTLHGHTMTEMIFGGRGHKIAPFPKEKGPGFAILWEY
jgi:hypothetical protein